MSRGACTFKQRDVAAALKAAFAAGAATARVEVGGIVVVAERNPEARGDKAELPKEGEDERRGEGNEWDAV